MWFGEKNNQKDFLPVFDESLDELRGIIDLYGITSFLSNEDKSIESLIDSLDEAYFTPENTPLSTQLFNFQNNKKTVAVVIDEYGTVKGIVSIKDVLEEIVGELATEIDKESVEIMEQKDGSYLIDASIPLRELNKKLNFVASIEERSKSYYVKKALQEFLNERLEKEMKGLITLPSLSIA